MGKSILVVALRLIGKTPFAGTGGEDKCVICPKVNEEGIEIRLALASLRGGYMPEGKGGACVSVARRRQSTVSKVWRGVFGVLTKRLRAP